MKRYFYCIFFTVHFIFFAILVDGQGVLRSYSINNKTGRYTYCFDRIAASVDSNKSIKLCKAIYRLDSFSTTRDKAAILHFKKQFRYDTIQASLLKPTSVIDKNFLRSYISLLNDSIYSLAKRLFRGKAEGNMIRKFKIDIVDQKIDLVQPDESDNTLHFPKWIIEDVLRKSMLNMYGQIPRYMNGKDSAKKRDDKKYDFFDDDDDNEQPQTIAEVITDLTEDDDCRMATLKELLEWINVHNEKKPPCIPFITKKEFQTLVRDRSMFRQKFTKAESEKYASLLKGVNKKDFVGELVCDDCPLSERETAYFYDILDLVDSTKIRGDFKKLVQFTARHPMFVYNDDTLGADDDTDDRIGEHYDDPEDIDDWLQQEVLLQVISNYMALETYKYFTFLIAHEAYHYWFNSHKIGDKYEFEADKFSTLLYVKLFSDSKFMGSFSALEEQTSKIADYMGVHTGSNNKDGDDDDNNSSMAKDPYLQAFIGQPVFSIFKDVYLGTQFYENPMDPFHPSVKLRVLKIKSLIDKSSKEVKDELTKYFQNISYKLFSK